MQLSSINKLRTSNELCIVASYDLHEQTGRWAVCVNGKQNLRLVTFVVESRLPFVQTSSIYRKTAAKAWNKYQRWLYWGNGTRNSVWNIPYGKAGLPFQMFRGSRKFSAGTTKKFVFHQVLLNGKQLSPLTIICSQIYTFEYKWKQLIFRSLQSMTLK